MTEHENNFAEVIRYLLAHTFIVNIPRQESLYRFCKNESNKEEINKYLFSMGYHIEVNTAMGVVQLQNTAEADNELRNKSESLVTFTKLTQLTIAVLWQIYKERALGVEVVISSTKLREEVLNYYPSCKKNIVTEALPVLKQFNIIGYSSARADDFAITIYPSVLMALNAEKFTELISESNKESEDESDV